MKINMVRVSNSSINVSDCNKLSNNSTFICKGNDGDDVANLMPLYIAPIWSCQPLK